MTDRESHQPLREGLIRGSAHDMQVERILTSTAWVTPLIVLANLVVFAAMATEYSSVIGFDPVQLAAWGANSGTLDLTGQWWRLLTYQFLHINLIHVALNMWVMWTVGRLTERLYGSITLLFLYLASGALAGLASIIWIPSQVSVGAPDRYSACSAPSSPSPCAAATMRRPRCCATAGRR